MFPAGTRGRLIGSMRSVFLLPCREKYGMMSSTAVKETGKPEVVEVAKMMPAIGIMTIVFAALTIYLCHDEYKNGQMSSKNFKIVAFCEGLAILGMLFLIIS